MRQDNTEEINSSGSVQLTLNLWEWMILMKVYIRKEILEKESPIYFHYIPLKFFFFFFFKEFQPMMFTPNDNFLSSEKVTKKKIISCWKIIKYFQSTTLWYFLIWMMDLIINLIIETYYYVRLKIITLLYSQDTN